MRNFVFKLIFAITSLSLLFLVFFYFLGPDNFRERSKVGEVSKTTRGPAVGGPLGEELALEEVSFEVVDKPYLDSFKSYSRILELRGGTVVKNAQDWNSYFQALGGSVDQGTPEIADFSKADLVVVSGGIKATDGYSVKVSAVDLGGRKIIVNVKETEPGETCEVSATANTPADFVVIEKTENPVEFNFVSDIKSCP